MGVDEQVRELARRTPNFGYLLPHHSLLVTCGVLALALDVWPLVTGGLVFAGTVTNALLAAHMVRCTRQALDIAAGLAASR